MAEPINPPHGSDDALVKVIKELRSQVQNLSTAIKTLSGNVDEQKDALQKVPAAKLRMYERAAKEEGFVTPSGRADLKRYAKDRGYDSISELWQEEYTRISRAGGSGVSGLFKTLMASGLPDPEKALPFASFGRAFSGGGTTRAYAFGELIRQASVRYRPEGSKAYDAQGRMIPYSSGVGLGALSPEQKQAILAPGVLDDLILNQEVTGDPKLRARQIKLAKGEFRTAEGAGKAREDIVNHLLGRGQSLEMLMNSESPLIRSAAKTLSSGTGVMGALGGLASRVGFGAGGALMGGARLLSGPIGTAITAGQVAYDAANTLYDPARSAAGLGYGFSYNPFSAGAQVSMNRSLQTRMDALFSMGLSGQQTAAARAALEGMGVGGPGSENMYGEYYKSMTDVIEQTQLDTSALAPFYEQFLRQGGTEDELGKLTKMLRDDLPKAAAASRMSLQQMAQAVQQTTEAVSQSPYNMRTKTEISQALISAQAAGAPPGMMGIAGGQNALITAQTASRLGVSYFSASQQASQLQITAAETLKQTVGDMTGDEFAEYRLTDQGALQVMVASSMTGLSPDDMQKLYDQGLNDFQGASALTGAFSDTQLGKARTKKVPVFAGRYGGRGGNIPTRDVVTSQMIRGKNVDLYRSTGSDIQSLYEEPISTIESALKAQDPNAYEDFQKQLDELGGKQGIETWNLLKKYSQDIGANTSKDSKDGTIDLSDEAKKYFKLSFGSDYVDSNPPTDRYNYGGTKVG
jgi:hypothetical protein